MEQVIIQKGRTVILPVSLWFDASGDVFTSQIRVDKDPESDLIAEWTVTFETDGTDGELRLTLDDSVTSAITHSKGYMDIKRVTNGEPVSVWEEPLEVLIKSPVTV